MAKVKDLDKNEDEWRALIRGTAMKRARVKGLLRNLMVVAGNSGIKDLAPRLMRFLDHVDDGVRRHAAWAIEKLSAGVRT